MAEAFYTYPDNEDYILLKSQKSGLPFSISTAEIQAYKKHRAPLPRTRYDERMTNHILSMGPISPEIKTCAKTGKEVQNFAPAQLQMQVWDKDKYDREFQ